MSDSEFDDSVYQQKTVESTNLSPGVGIPHAPKFRDDCRDPNEWICTYEDSTELYRWTDRMRVKYIHLFVDDSHRGWVRRLIQEGHSWTQFKKIFEEQARERLGLGIVTLLKQLNDVKMHTGESVLDYVDRFNNISVPLGTNISDFEKVRQFVQGLNRNLRDFVLQNIECTSPYPDVVRASVEAERFYFRKKTLLKDTSDDENDVYFSPATKQNYRNQNRKDGTRHNNNLYQTKRLAEPTAKKEDDRDDLRSELESIKKEFNKLCAIMRQQHNGQSYVTPPNNNSSISPVITPNNNNIPAYNQGRHNPPRNEGSNYRCFHCGDPSHLRRDCPHLTYMRNQSNPPPPPPAAGASQARSITASLVPATLRVEKALSKANRKVHFADEVDESSDCDCDTVESLVEYDSDDEPALVAKTGGRPRDDEDEDSEADEESANRKKPKTMSLNDHRENLTPNKSFKHHNKPRRDRNTKSRPDKEVEDQMPEDIKKPRYNVKPAVSQHARAMEEISKEMFRQPMLSLSLAEGITHIPELRNIVQNQVSTRTKEAIRELKEPKKNVPTNNVQTESVAVQRAAAEDQELRQETPLVPGKINNKPVNCVIDNGQELDLISNTFLTETLKLEPDRPATYTMKSANGNIDSFSGVIEDLDVNIEGIHARTSFFVATKSSCDVLLGAPWIRRVGARFEWQGCKQFCSISDTHGDKSVRFVVARASRRIPNIFTRQIEAENKQREILVARILLWKTPSPSCTNISEIENASPLSLENVTSISDDEDNDVFSTFDPTETSEYHMDDDQDGWEKWIRESILKILYNKKTQLCLQNSEKPTQTLLVTGNIGAGKSTLLSNFARKSICAPALEVATIDKEILQKYYEDYHAGHYHLYEYMLQHYYKPKQNSSEIFEGSAHCGLFAFAAAEVELHQMQLEQLERLVDFFFSHDYTIPEYVIHIQTPVETILSRLEGKQKVNTFQLQILDFYFNRLLQAFAKLGTQVYILDGNLQEEEVANSALSIIMDINIENDLFLANASTAVTQHMDKQGLIRKIERNLTENLEAVELRKEIKNVLLQPDLLGESVIDPNVTVISGTVGAGKSTLLTTLAKLSVIPKAETEVALNDLDLLIKYYENKKEWAYTLQKRILHEYHRQKPGCLVQERSPIDSLFVFCAASTEQGNMSPDQFELLSYIYREYNFSVPRKYIHLHLPAHIALQRIHQRGNKYEQNITLKELEILEYYYNFMLQCLEKLGCEVHIVDASKPANVVATMVKNILTKDQPNCRHLTLDRERELRFGPTVTPDMKELALETFRKHSKVFAFDMSEMGRSTLVEHEIPTGEAKPIKAHPFRLPRKMKEQLAVLVDEMCELKMLEDSGGAWALPAFLIPKKTPGKYRLVGDMRKLNDVTIPDVYPLPFCDQLVDDMAGYQWYTIIDAMQGFFQIPIRKQDRDKTTIYTPRGLKRFTVMCMGLRNAPATWQRLMETLLKDILCNTATSAITVFADDIAIGSTGTFEEHIELVCQVLEKFEEANLTISALKSVFGQQEALYLGSILDKNGIRPDPEKLRKVETWPVPTCVKHCRAFLGLVGYYRRFIPNFAKEARPITDLLKKNKTYLWSDAEQKAFEYLRDTLLSATTLSKPIYDDPNRPFEISCDAQDFAVGYVLEQKDSDGIRKPIAFGGRGLSKHEINYTVTEKECLALVEAIKKFHHYVYGEEFVVWVDHKALQWLFNKPDLGHGRLMRWVILLQTYNFKVCYKEGKKHQNADSMSRRPNQEVEINTGDDALEAQVYTTTAYHQYRLLREYLATCQLPEGISKTTASQLKRKANQFCLLKGELYKRSKDGVPKRVVLSPEEQLEILEANHDDISGGHRGRDATFKKIKYSYWWPNFYEDIKNFVASCDACQRHKKLKVFEPLEPLPVQGIFARVHIDLVGPLPSSYNKKYILLARDSFSGWVEGRALERKDAASVIKFIKEEIVYRHGVVGQITADRGSENKNEELAKAQEALGIPMVFTTAYHPQSNGLVERGHKPLVGTLVKWCQKNKKCWQLHLGPALWADRITTKRTTGMTPFRMLYGREAVLPIEMQIETFAMVNLSTQWSTEELLEARLTQLLQQTEEHEAIKARLRKYKKKMKKYFDKKKPIRRKRLQVGDAVLLYEGKLMEKKGKKFQFPWLGPYVIRQVMPHGSYKLRELNGTHLNNTYTGHRLKIYLHREHFQDQEVEEEADRQETQEDPEAATNANGYDTEDSDNYTDTSESDTTDSEDSDDASDDSNAQEVISISTELTSGAP